MKISTIQFIEAVLKKEITGHEKLIIQMLEEAQRKNPQRRISIFYSDFHIRRIKTKTPMAQVSSPKGYLYVLHDSTWHLHKIDEKKSKDTNEFTETALCSVRKRSRGIREVKIIVPEQDTCISCSMVYSDISDRPKNSP